jgi:LemA protein
MKKVFIGCGVLAVLGIIVLIIVLAGFGSYNKLVTKSAGADAQWAQVQNQYQRRAELIPNLVNTVSGAANFEKSTLTEIADARASVGKMTIDVSKAPATAEQLAEFEKAQGQLGSALSRLMSITENYPDLKANQSFRDLQAQLEGTENRIAVERGNFNTAVQSYNVAVKSMPTALYAGMMGFKEKPYFAASAGAEKAPEVKFDLGGKK